MRPRKAIESEPNERDYSASHGIVVDLVHKVLYRFGSQPLLRRLLHSGRELASPDTQQKPIAAGRPWFGRSGEPQAHTLAASTLPSGAPSLGESPSLLAGFNAFLEKEHGRDSCRSVRSPVTSPAADDVPPLELSPEAFEAMLQATPPEIMPAVLVERKSEYGEHLRHLERARKDLLSRLADLDNRILRAVEERKAIGDRLGALSSEEDEDRKGAQQAESPGGLPAGANAKTVVEDVSDDDGDDEGISYEQDDAPRLRKLANVFCGHYGAITAVDCDSTMGLAASGSLDTQVRIWDMATGECQHTISGHNDIVRQVQFHDRFLLTASNDCRIRMWDLSLLDSVKPRPSTRVMREEYVPRERRHQDSSSSSNTDAEDDDDGGHMEMTLQSTTPLMTPSICRYMPPLELCCETTLVGHADAVTCFQATGNTLISGSADKTVREWDLVSGALRQTIDVAWAARDSLAPPRTRPASMWATMPSRAPPVARPPLPFGADGGHAARGTECGDGGFVGALQFYECALATGSADGCLRLWDLRTAQAHRQMHGHTKPITSLQFDDRSVLTGSLDGTAILWDLRTGHIVQRLELGNLVTAVQLRRRPATAAAGHAASYDMECWAAARDPFLHRYMASSMQRVRYAADYGRANDRRSRLQIVAQSTGVSAITRIRCLGDDAMASGDADGVVKIWQL
ncbi:Mitochondrial fission protein [Coemansia nantahalensis]|uniref:Mitochondrial fission protein n=1 Tax=Coemansia nantahalensis TaxID=2789366 RepID=A0ACC1K3B6_9FUNG|nr:Mitochondrial fission protein [Coemansia nantahalensis]